MKPGIGPIAFHRDADSVVRRLQAGETVAIEMRFKAGDQLTRAASVRILEKLVWLAEGVGEVQQIDIGESVRPKVVLIPVQPPSAAESPVPVSPRMPR
jgi:hypothetical protein